MVIVTLLNQKGGVGKTSTCHHLAGAFARLGLRVHLIDYDPQASLTQGLLGPDGAAAIPPDQSAAAIGRGDYPDPIDLARAIPPVEDQEDLPGVSITPGNPALAEWNSANPGRESDHVRARLRRYVAMLPSTVGCHVTLIDCPPNLQLLSAQAMVASTHLIIPVQAEDYGVQGLRPVLDFLAEARDRDAPKLSHAGILLNMFDRRSKLHKFYEAKLLAQYGEDVLATRVGYYRAFAEGVLQTRPVTHTDKRSKAALAIRELAHELLARLWPDGLPLPGERESEVARG